MDLIDETDEKTKRQNSLWRLSKVSTMSNASAFNFDPAWKKRRLLCGNRPRLATRRLDRVFRRIMALRNVFRDKLSPNFISIGRQGRRMTQPDGGIESFGFDDDVTEILSAERA